MPKALGASLHFLYCDETNLEERAGDFLIYGGLLIEASKALSLSLAIDELRARHGIAREYRLKFNPGPDGLSHAAFIALKQELIELVASFGGKLMTYLVLHDIARSPDEARRNGINCVCFHFHLLLEKLGGPGMVLIDRFTDQGNAIEGHLRDKFTIGVTGLPFTPELRLKNIIGFHYSTIGQSHLPSVIDILLGSLRFAINTHTRDQSANMVSARTILGLLSPIFWRLEPGAPVPEIGIQFSPKQIRGDRYRAKYLSTKKFLADCGVAIYQDFSDPDSSILSSL